MFHFLKKKNKPQLNATDGVNESAQRDTVVEPKKLNTVRKSKVAVVFGLIIVASISGYWVIRNKITETKPTTASENGKEEIPEDQKLPEVDIKNFKVQGLPGPEITEKQPNQ